MAIIKFKKNNKKPTAAKVSKSNTFVTKATAKPNFYEKQSKRFTKAKVDEAVNKMKHKKKTDKLKRKAEINKIKAEAAANKPKNIAKKENQKYNLEKLRASERVQIEKYKNQWKNTLAGGVSSAANVNALMNEDGRDVQEEIANALGGIDQVSGPVPGSVKN